MYPGGNFYVTNLENDCRGNRLGSFGTIERKDNMNKSNIHDQCVILHEKHPRNAAVAGVVQPDF